MQQPVFEEDELLSFRGFIVLLLLGIVALASTPPRATPRPPPSTPPLMWAGLALCSLVISFLLSRPFSTTLHATLLSSNVVTENLLTFLRFSHSSVLFSFSITPGGTTVSMSLTRRSSLPTSRNRLKKELEGLFSTYNIKLLWDKPSSSDGREFWVHRPDRLPSLDKIVLDLVSMHSSPMTLRTHFSSGRGDFRVSVSFIVPDELRGAVSALVLSYGTKLTSRPYHLSSADSKEMYRLLKFKPLAEFPLAPVIMGEDHGEMVIGSQLLEGNEFSEFKISSSDLREGGLITGAIGQGKTNLRLHLIRKVREDGVRVIDFDLKGDVCRYPALTAGADVLVPGTNFSINIFQCPPNMGREEYAQLLFTSLLELFGTDELSPPQRYLLERAVHVTVTNSGSPRDFLETIVVLAEHDKKVLENRQDASAIALVTKFSWMYRSLRNVVWTSRTTTGTGFLSRSTYFDLSTLYQNVPVQYISLLIELILIRVITKFSGNDPSPLPKVLISIDEAQILIPRRNNQRMSKLEQIVTTMRYRGIAVLAAGVNANMMSDVLLDTGFSAKFHNGDDNLLPYECVVRKRSSRFQPVHARIQKFPLQPHPPVITPIRRTRLPGFSISRELIETAKEVARYPSLTSVPLSKIRFLTSLLDNVADPSADDQVLQDLLRDEVCDSDAAGQLVQLWRRRTKVADRIHSSLL